MTPLESAVASKALTAPLSIRTSDPQNPATATDPAASKSRTAPALRIQIFKPGRAQSQGRAGKGGGGAPEDKREEEASG